VRRFSARELRDYLERTDTRPLLLDVREPWEYQVCRIDGAQLVPMRQIPTAVDQLDPARETVVICHHGVRSFAVARFLEQAGFTNVINLDGGVAAWARDVDPTMPTY
jgi:rhodanese-related sulfurtransferase